jgi:hypothetical protein
VEEMALFSQQRWSPKEKGSRSSMLNAVISVYLYFKQPTADDKVNGISVSSVKLSTRVFGP